MQPTTSNTSVRQLARLLKKFHIQDGDILALKYKTPIADTSVIEDITNALQRMGLINVLVVVVEDFGDMSVLNETQMQAHGWFKLKTLAKVMKLPEGEIKQ